MMTETHPTKSLDPRPEEPSGLTPPVSPKGEATPGTPTSPDSHRTIRRILITSAWFGALCALAGWILWGGMWALGLAGGLLVGMAHLVFLAILADLVLVTGRRRWTAAPSPAWKPSWKY